MRLEALLAAMVGAMVVVGSAAAEQPRYLPAVGTTVTYRLMVTLNLGDREAVVGQVYRLTTTASDGTTAQSTLTPLALIWRCPDTDTSKDCQQARNFPD